METARRDAAQQELVSEARARALVVACYTRAMLRQLDGTDGADAADGARGRALREVADVDAATAPSQGMPAHRQILSATSPLSPDRSCRRGAAAAVAHQP